MPHNHRIDKDFLNKMWKEKTIREENCKSDFRKIKILFIKDIVKKLKGQSIDWAKYSKYIYLTKDLY